MMPSVVKHIFNYDNMMVLKLHKHKQSLLCKKNLCINYKNSCRWRFKIYAKNEEYVYSQIKLSKMKIQERKHESVSVVRFSWLTSGQIVIIISFGPLQPAVVDICFAFQTRLQTIGNSNQLKIQNPLCLVQNKLNIKTLRITQLQYDWHSVC